MALVAATLVAMLGAAGPAQAVVTPLSFSRSPIAFGTVLVGGSSGLSTTVTYTTSVNATYAYVGIDSATISGADAANFAVTGNTCGFINLAGTGYNESCSITVTFTPTSGGAKSAQLDVAWHNTGGPSGTQSVSLTGTGAQPLTFTPSPLAFGTVGVGGSSGLSTTVTYTTSVNATYAYVGIDSATISGADAANFAVTGNTCGFINLAGTGYNESCSITVTFTPTSGGAKSAQLDVAWHNTGGPSGTQSVSLTGTGAQPAPKPNPQLPVEAFCVKTKERGNTFVQANPASFKPGGDWYALWSTNSKVVLDGHAVTLWFEDGNGVILAANVPGVGLTCDQPYVTADLKYADPSYGNR